MQTISTKLNNDFIIKLLSSYYVVWMHIKINDRKIFSEILCLLSFNFKLFYVDFFISSIKNFLKDVSMKHFIFNLNSQKFHEI